jgi:hypothetical protein
MRTIVVHSHSYSARETPRADPSVLAAAYLLASFSVFGFAGLHRFYLGKPLTGALWMLTWGLFGFGTLYDLVTMNLQVEQSLAHRQRGDSQRSLAPASESLALETQILRLASQRQGRLSALEVAAELSVSLVHAERALDDLARSTHVNIEVREDGVVAYDFPGLRRAA